MSSFLRLTARSLPLRPSIRFNSSSSSASSATARARAASSARAERMLEMAASSAHKTSPLEAGVPLMWAAVGVLGYVAWGRIAEEDRSVEKLLIV